MNDLSVPSSRLVNDFFSGMFLKDLEHRYRVHLHRRICVSWSLPWLCSLCPSRLPALIDQPSVLPILCLGRCHVRRFAWWASQAVEPYLASPLWCYWVYWGHRVTESTAWLPASALASLYTSKPWLTSNQLTTYASCSAAYYCLANCYCIAFES